MYSHASMNRAYRLVWSSVQQAWVAVAENVKGKGKGGRGRRLLKALGQVFLVGACLTDAAWPQTIPNNARGGNTNVFNAPNGVPVVNIANPNAAGLSHNQYSHFNVDQKGLVLNNAVIGQPAAQAQLAGALLGNPNLSSSANVILNEVVAANRSQLSGYMEVFGKQAEVVVANPYGITCNGCGFINSPRATLTTGTPVIGAGGGLDGFTVNGGDISVSGSGLDARSMVLDIVARGISVDGQINSADLGLTAGSNRFDQLSRIATPIAGNGGAPAFAIDSTLLGGMYANRIKIVATEAGVGVRMLAEAGANNGNLTLDAAGKVTLQSHLSASGNLDVKGSASLGNTAIEIAGSAASLTSGGGLNLVAGAGNVLISEGGLHATGKLNLSGGDLLDTSVTSASRTAEGRVGLDFSGAVSIAGSTWSSGADFSAKAGAMTLGAASLASAQSMNLAASSGNLALGNVTVKALDDVMVSAVQGDISTDVGGSVNAGDMLSTTAANTLTNKGALQASGAMVVNSSGSGPLSLANSGVMRAGGALTLGTAEHKVQFANTGTVLGATLSVAGDALDNSGKVEGSNGVTLDISGSVTNRAAGYIQSTSGGDVTVKSASFHNAGITSAAATASLTTIAGALANTGTIQGRGTTINAAEDISNSATGQILASENLNILAGTGRTFVNNGLLQASGAVQIGDAAHLQSIVNQSGAVVLGDTVGMRAATLTNHGSLQGIRGVSVTADAMHNRAGANIFTTDEAVGDIHFALKRAENAGTVQSAHNLAVTTTETLLNQVDGQLLTTGVGSMALTAADISNAGLLSSGGALSSTTRIGAISNLGTIQSGGDMALTAATVLNNGDATHQDATISSGRDLDVLSGGSVNNAARIEAAGTVQIGDAAHKHDVVNQGSAAILGDKLLLIATAVSNSGILQGDRGVSITADALDNRVGASILSTDASAGDITLTLPSFDNSGTVQSAGELAVAASGSLVNEETGLLLTTGAGRVSLASASMRNAGMISSTGALDATTSAGSITNTGTIQSSENLLLDAATELRNGDASHSDATIASAGQLTALTGATIFNSAHLEAAGAVQLGDAIHRHDIVNENGAVILGDSLALQAATVTNSGNLQGDRGVSVAADVLDNRAGANIFSTDETSGDITFVLPSFDNAGTVQSAHDLSVQTAGSLANRVDAQLLTTGTGQLQLSASEVNNSGMIASGGAMAVTTSANGISNSGTMQSLGASTLTAKTSISNSGTLAFGDTANLSALTTIDNSGSLRGLGTANIAARDQISNSGTAIIVFGDDANLAAGTISNSVNAKIVGEGDVRFSGSSAGSFAFDNQGLVQAASPGATLSIGDQTHLATISNGSISNTAAKLVGDSLAFVGNAVDNFARVQAITGTSISASNFYNHGSNSVLLANIDDSASVGSVLKLSGSLTNEGAMHGNSDLTVNANNIINASTGGLSSLANLSLNSSSHISNAGALYAGANLNATASSGKIWNQTSGTISTDGDFIASSRDFENNNEVVSEGDITLSTTNSFRNRPTGLSYGADGVTMKKASSGISCAVGSCIDPAALYDSSGDKNVLVIQDKYQETESLDFAASAPNQFPSIIGKGAASTLTVNFGNVGENTAATLSAPTINIGGSGTFTNQAVAAYKKTYTSQIVVFTDNSGAPTYLDNYGALFYSLQQSLDSGAELQPINKLVSGADSWQTYNAGPPGSEWSVANRADYHGPSGLIDSPNRLKNWVDNYVIDYRAAILANKYFVLTDIEQVGAAWDAHINASNFNFTSGTLNNIGVLFPNKTTGVNSTVLSPALVKKNAAVAPVAEASAPGDVPERATLAIGAAFRGNRKIIGASVESKVGGLVPGEIPASAKAYVRPLETVAPLIVPGLKLTLPANPNGYYVAAKEPAAHYLVELNPLFQTSDNLLSSDYLLESLGYSPDNMLTRLGDGNYETYLVRQQIIAQRGARIIKGYNDETAQLKALMKNAVDLSDKLRLKLGMPLTSEQQALLAQDIVWLVEQEVSGVRVLVPVVYLSAATAGAKLSGAVIEAERTSIKGEALNNKGGTIVGSDSVSVKVKKDIVNTSGDIRGGEVSLQSVEGNIVNETFAQTTGNSVSAKTIMGRTAGITATKGLTLNAKKNIQVKGANVSSDGGAKLVAGESVTFDTIVDKTATTTESKDGQKTTLVNTVSEKNIGSLLQVKGNTKVETGKDFNLFGSQADLKGALDTDVKGNITIGARQDKTTTTTISHEEGAGVGGGLYGIVDTRKEEFEGKNKGSALYIGGDTKMQANKLTIQGSALRTKGNVDLDLQQLEVKQGLDERSSKTEVKTLTVLGGAASSTSGQSEASTESAAKSGEASAKASASAGVGADGSVNLFSVKKETTTTYDSTAVASIVEIGGKLKAKVKEDVTIQGSDVAVAGRSEIEARNVNLLAAEEKHTTKYESEENAIKLTSKNRAEASASAEVSASKTMSAKAEAQAKAEAATDNVIGFNNTKIHSEEENINQRVSTFKVGGDSKITASETLRTQGAQIETGGNLSIKAKNQENLAAESSSRKSSSVETTTVGMYIGAGADAGAEASASAKLTGVSASASATAGSEAGAGLHVGYQSEKSESGSTKNQVTSYKTGGNFQREANEVIRDVGTAIDVGGDMTQKAETVKSEAARDTSYSRTEKYDATFRVGQYGEARAGADASAEASMTGGAGAEANAYAKATTGVKAGFGFEKSVDSEKSSTAVTSTIKTGGNFKSESKGSSTFEGTQIDAGGDAKVAGKSVAFNEARNTLEKSSSSDKFDASAKGGGGVAASAGTEGGAKAFLQGEAGASAGYAGTRSSSEKSTAVVSNIRSGGKTQIESTGGDVHLAGTNIDAGGEIELTSKGGNVKVVTARDTFSSTSTSASASVGLAAEAGGGKNTASLDLAGGYQSKSESSDRAVTSTFKSRNGGVQINSEKDVTMEGVQLNAPDGTRIKAGGNVELKAAESKSSSQEYGVDVSASVSKDRREKNAKVEKERGVNVDASLGYASSDQTSYQQVGGTGPIKVDSAGSVLVEGNGVKAQDIKSGTGTTFTQVQDSKHETFGGFSIGAEKSKESERKNAKADVPSPVINAGEAAQNRRQGTGDQAVVQQAGEAAQNRRQPKDDSVVVSQAGEAAQNRRKTASDKRTDDASSERLPAQEVSAGREMGPAPSVREETGPEQRTPSPSLPATQSNAKLATSSPSPAAAGTPPSTKNRDSDVNGREPAGEKTGQLPETKPTVRIVEPVSRKIDTPDEARTEPAKPETGERMVVPQAGEAAQIPRQATGDPTGVESVGDTARIRRQTTGETGAADTSLKRSTAQEKPPAHEAGPISSLKGNSVPDQKVPSSTLPAAQSSAKLAIPSSGAKAVDRPDHVQPTASVTTPSADDSGLEPKVREPGGKSDQASQARPAADIGHPISGKRDATREAQTEPGKPEALAQTQDHRVGKYSAPNPASQQAEEVPTPVVREKQAQEYENDPTARQNGAPVAAPPPPPPPAPPLSIAKKDPKPKVQVEGISDDQRLISEYSGPGYDLINKYLRGNFDPVRQRRELVQRLVNYGLLDSDEVSDKQLDDAMRVYTNKIADAIKRLPPSEGITVTYRGIALDRAAVEGLKKQYSKVGSIVTERGFMSTSPSKAWVNDTAIEMSLPPGHDGRMLGAAAKFDHEQEMLFPPGTRLRIDEVLERGNPGFDQKIALMPLSDNSADNANKVRRIIKVTLMPPASGEHKGPKPANEQAEEVPIPVVREVQVAEYDAPLPVNPSKGDGNAKPVPSTAPATPTGAANAVAGKRFDLAKAGRPKDRDAFYDSKDFSPIKEALRESMGEKFDDRRVKDLLNDYASRTKDEKQFANIDGERLKTYLQYDLTLSDAQSQYMTKKGWKEAFLREVNPRVPARYWGTEAEKLVPKAINQPLDVQQGIEMYRAMPKAEAEQLLEGRFDAINGHLGDLKQAGGYFSNSEEQVLMKFQLRPGAHKQLFSPANLAIGHTGEPTNYMHAVVKARSQKDVQMGSKNEGKAPGLIGVKSEKSGEGFSFIAGDRKAKQKLEGMMSKVTALDGPVDLRGKNYDFSRPANQAVDSAPGPKPVDKDAEEVAIPVVREKQVQEYENDPTTRQHGAPVAAPPPPPPPAPPLSIAKKDPKPKVQVEGISDDQRLISEYSGPGYDLINKYLRGNFDPVRQRRELVQRLVNYGLLDSDEVSDKQLDDAMRVYTNKIADAIKRLPPSEGITVTYRGIALDRAAVEELKKQYSKVGSIVTERGFMSTSPSKAWVNDTAIEMSLPPGHDGRMLGAAAKFDHEQEMLFPPGTRLRIDEVLERGNPGFDQKIALMPLSDNSADNANKVRRIIKVTLMPPASGEHNGPKPANEQAEEVPIPVVREVQVAEYDAPLPVNPSKGDGNAKPVPGTASAAPAGAANAVAGKRFDLAKAGRPKDRDAFYDSKDFSPIKEALRESMGEKFDDRRVKDLLNDYASRTKDEKQFANIDGERLKTYLQYDLTLSDAQSQYMTKKGWKEAFLREVNPRVPARYWGTETEKLVPKAINQPLDVQQGIEMYRAMPKAEAEQLLEGRFDAINGHLGDLKQAGGYFSNSQEQVLMKFQLRPGAHKQLFSPDNLAIGHTGEPTNYMHAVVKARSQKDVQMGSKNEGKAPGLIGVKSEKSGEGFSFIAGDRKAKQKLEGMMSKVTALDGPVDLRGKNYDFSEPGNQAVDAAPKDAEEVAIPVVREKQAQEYENDPTARQNGAPVAAPPPPPPPAPPLSIAKKDPKPKVQVEGISDDQRLISEYSGPGYDLINKYLRGNFDPVRQRRELVQRLVNYGLLDSDEVSDKQLDDAMRVYTNKIADAIKRLPPSEGITVTYRGIALDRAAVEELKKQYSKVGSIVTERGFMSTSPSKAWVNDTAIEMSLPPGHDGRMLGAAAKFDHEQEMLFPPGTRLRIDEVLERGNPGFDQKIASMPLSDNSADNANKVRRIVKVTVLPAAGGGQ